MSAFIEVIQPFAEAAGVVAIGLAALLALGVGVYFLATLWEDFTDAD